MDDAVPAERTPELPRSRGHVLTPRRIAAVIAFAVLAVRLRRHLRFARDVFRLQRILERQVRELAGGVLGEPQTRRRYFGTMVTLYVFGPGFGETRIRISSTL